LSRRRFVLPPCEPPHRRGALGGAPAGNLDGHAAADAHWAVTLLLAAAACLIAAQILGIYALRTRKADLIFSIFMVTLVVAALTLGYMGARQKLG
jgi:hypothetical protein